MSDDFDMSEFQDIFFEECAEGLDIMENGLMSLDESVDTEFINTIFRAAHSIKGGGGTFGFTRITQFTHSVETILGEFREHTRPVTRPVVDLLLQACDVLRHMTGAMQEGRPVDEEKISEVQTKLEAVLNNTLDDDQSAEGAEQDPSAAAATNGEQSADSAEDSAEDDRFVKIIGWKGSLSGISDQQIIEQLQKLHSVESAESILIDAADPSSLVGIRVIVHGENQEVEEALEWISEATSLKVESCAVFAEPVAPQKAVFYSNVDFDDAEQSAEQSAPAADTASASSTDAGAAGAVAESKATDVAAVAAQPPPSVPAEKPKATAAPSVKQADAPKAAAQPDKSAASATIRVNIEKVDEIINLVGELVITQSIVSECCKKINEVDEELRSGLEQLGRHTRSLQDSVMKIRMLPISFVFNRFPRMVRDISSQLGKQIELKVIGEATELDKTVLESISDPLVHLVRNSVDHGIEIPEIRRAAGKPPTGNVTLEAFHEGGSVVIKIVDDGKGLDRDRIREKAIEKGLISSEDFISDEKIYELIFHPGFSTANEVSDLSGRGVGMDVVKRNIRDLSGTVEVTSTEGEGTVFTVRLPLTLAIIDGQLARVGNETYVVPVLSVIESNQLHPERVSRVSNGSDLYRFRDEYIPIIRISEIFQIEPKKSSQGLLIIVDAEGGKAGLHVDELLGQQQVVIKGLDTNYRSIPGLSGATILGDGRVAMILDIAGIINNDNWYDKTLVDGQISTMQKDHQALLAQGDAA